MKKIKALIRYELLDLKRTPLFWIMGFLYLFTLQQILSNMKLNGEIFLNLISFNKDSWLILNFLMIPIFYIAFKIGKSQNEMLLVNNINKGQYLSSKFLTILLINIVIMVLNLIVFCIIAIVSKVSLSYFLNNFITFIINNIIALLTCSSIGIFLGFIINRYIGDVLSYILIIIMFIKFSNFYNEPKYLFPLIYSNVLSSNFYVNGYEKIYEYHNYFWIILSTSFIILTFITGCFDKKKKHMLIYISILLIITAYYSIIYWNKMLELKPVKYTIYSKNDTGNVKDKNGSFYSDNSCGYSVINYNMVINLGDEIHNKCDMSVVVEKDNLNTLEFGLYSKLNITEVTIDNVDVTYTKKNNSFIVSLPSTFKKGETINLSVCYNGIINTIGPQARTLFYVGDKRVFLGDVFEWYPKQNDNKKKNYNVKVSYSGLNTLFSNLDIIKNDDYYELIGNDKELMLISGDIQSMTYNNINFIGNEEFLKNKNFCDDVIAVAEKNGYKNTNKIIIGPFMLGTGIKMEENYESAYFYSER